MSMSDDPVIFVLDADPLTFSQCIAALRGSGNLAATVGVILRHAVIIREIKRRNGLLPRPQLVDAVVHDFCAQSGVDDPDALAEFLAMRGQDVGSLRDEIERELSLEHLKHEVTAPNLDAYFRSRSPFLEKITIARLSVPDRRRAEKLLERLSHEPAVFPDIAFDCLRRERSFELETSFIVDLPDPVRRDALPARIGDILGLYEDRTRAVWFIYRVEGRYSASLEDFSVKQKLRDELFEQWIASQLEAAHIEVAFPFCGKLEH
jgi:hypothetical protein